MTARTILVTGARAPVALHMARLLAEAGHRVHLADSLAHPLAAAGRQHVACHRLPPFRHALEGAADALDGLLTTIHADLVIPTCEEALYLGEIWRRRAMPAPLFAPPVERLEQVHDKFAFIELSRSLGLDVPNTVRLTSTRDLAALAPRSRELVLKPVWSRFGVETLIRPSRRRLARVTPTPERPWVAQDFVPGEEISAYAVAREGRLVALSAYRGLIRAGRGASVCFEPVADASVRRFVTAFVAGIGWTGQISFDLIRTALGRVLPIECNPRATSGLHFFRAAAPFASALLGDSDAEAYPDVSRPQGVRLALWLYGLPQVLRPGGLRALRDAAGRVEDVLAWPGDHVGTRAQVRSLAEFAGLALRHRISLPSAATRDIEWDGPPRREIAGGDTAR